MATAGGFWSRRRCRRCRQHDTGELLQLMTLDPGELPDALVLEPVRGVGVAEVEVAVAAEERIGREARRLLDDRCGLADGGDRGRRADPEREVGVASDEPLTERVGGERMRDLRSVERVRDLWAREERAGARRGDVAEGPSHRELTSVADEAVGGRAGGRERGVRDHRLGARDEADQRDRAPDRARQERAGRCPGDDPASAVHATLRTQGIGIRRRARRRSPALGDGRGIRHLLAMGWSGASLSRMRAGHRRVSCVLRALSSGGERFLDTEEVRGSNPLAPTTEAQVRGHRGGPLARERPPRPYERL